jgi:thymidylate synthase ThyX
MLRDSLGLTGLTLVEPEGEEECWVSLYISGSRGMSHEVVRHGDRTAMSQRSTRYVDEGGKPEENVPASPWIEHPLVTAYWADEKNCAEPNIPTLEEDKTPLGSHEKCLSCGAYGFNHSNNFMLRHHQQRTIRDAKTTYVGTVRALEPWLKAKGVDGGTARKQARGAARGYLGNALMTELIFSASVGQWKHMLKMRAANAADAEIRAVFTKALPLLKESRYGKFFEGMELEPAGDGLGEALAGGGHK